MSTAVASHSASVCILVLAWKYLAYRGIMRVTEYGRIVNVVNNLDVILIKNLSFLI